jgi:hypothetical protein
VTAQHNLHCQRAVDFEIGQNFVPDWPNIFVTVVLSIGDTKHHVRVASIHLANDWPSARCDYLLPHKQRVNGDIRGHSVNYFRRIDEVIENTTRNAVLEITKDKGAHSKRVTLISKWNRENVTDLDSNFDRHGELKPANYCLFHKNSLRIA